MNDKDIIEDKPFTDVSEIDDVRIIIKVNGKNYSILPKGDKEEAKQMRIAIGSFLLESHFVVTPSLEEIKINHQLNK